MSLLLLVLQVSGSRAPKWERCAEPQSSGTLGAVTMWGLDQEAADDVVGTASARLLAAGVPRDARRGALSLLGLLSASADDHGIVRRGFDDLVAEFELDPESAHGWLDDLVSVGIVHRGIGVLVLAGVEPAAPGGLRLADFLANVQAVDDADAARADEPTPLRRRVRPVSAIQAFVGAAAVLMAVVAVPLLGRTTNEPESVRAAAARADTTTAAPVATTTTSEAQRSTSTTAADAGGELPVVVPTTSTTVAPTECPVGEPLLEVLGVAQGAADGLSSVDGVARNTGTADLQLDGFTVTVTAAGEQVVVEGLDRPLTIPAGGSVRWTVLVPVAALPGAEAVATVDGWGWSDPDIAGACG